MPSDLIISVHSGGAFLQVHSFKYCVFSVFSFDFEHCLLDLLFPCQLFLFLFLLFQESGVIREEIKLFKTGLALRF